jgi:hypothetical protein
MLLCFRNQDPQASLELVVQGPDTETEEVTQTSVQDTAKLLVVRFKCEAEDT